MLKKYPFHTRSSITHLAIWPCLSYLFKAFFLNYSYDRIIYYNITDLCLWFIRAWEWKACLCCVQIFYHIIIFFVVLFLLNVLAGVPWVIAIACRRIMKQHWRISSELFNWIPDLHMLTHFVDMSMNTWPSCSWSYYVHKIRCFQNFLWSCNSLLIVGM